MKKELLTLSDYTKILQQLVNKFVRLRDKGLPCISCQKPIKGKTDAGHLRLLRLRRLVVVASPELDRGAF